MAKLDKDDIKRFCLACIFPARWPLIGHWFGYWVKWPAESLCAGFIMTLLTMMFFGAASAVNGGWFNWTTVIGTSAFLLLTLTLFITALTVLFLRGREKAQREKEKNEARAAKREAGLA